MDFHCHTIWYSSFPVLFWYTSDVQYSLCSHNYRYCYAWFLESLRLQWFMRKPLCASLFQAFFYLGGYKATGKLLLKIVYFLTWPLHKCRRVRALIMDIATVLFSLFNILFFVYTCYWMKMHNFIFFVYAVGISFQFSFACFVGIICGYIAWKHPKGNFIPLRAIDLVWVNIKTQY